MIIESATKLGQLATSLALALSLFSFVLSVLSVRQNAQFLLISARNAMYANFALATLGSVTLIWAFVTSDFSVAYVAQNSNVNLPMIYKISAMWGAHEGSLYLWLWYLTLFSAAVSWIHWKDHPLSMPWIIATFAAVQFGFLAFIVFLSNPFSSLTPMPPNGQDLNPLLQDPGLAFHPPVLYLGYVGFVVPFAFAISSLIRGHTGIEWVSAVRRWTLFAWAALTSGIIFGGYWAYYELGWGGYWAWDPVENASLMPWLTGTALLHSMMVQNKRGFFRIWNVFLVITTFLLTLLGTFLVRSGVLTSVHAFAVDPGRGTYMLIFLTVAMVVGYGLIVLRAERLVGDGEIDSPISRESAILANSILLMIVTATVFAGTLFPLALEVINGEKISVGAPYYNKVIVPIMICLLFLLGIGPSMPWRKMSPGRFMVRFRTNLALAIAFGLVSWIFATSDPITLVAIVAVSFAGLATLKDIWSAVKARMSSTDDNLLQAAGFIAVNARQRIGALIVHFGIILIAAGMIASGLFQSEQTVAMRVGDRVEIGSYTVTLRSLEDADGPNYDARRASFSVSQKGELLYEMAPEKRFYTARSMATTEVAIRSSFNGDLYIVMGDESPDGQLVARVFWNPLIIWIWLGWLVILIGSVMSLSKPTRKANRVKKQASASAVGTPAE